jgi:8-oxo-dGTP pyrophosphatase MutT (NUDIX family)
MKSRLDWSYRLAYRLAYPVIRRWWRLYGHDGVEIAVWLEDCVLAVRHSYKRGLHLPGGGIAKGEDHRITAVRELQEEVGIAIDPSQLRLVFTAKSLHGVLHFYEAQLEAMPALKIDRREIVEAVFCRRPLSLEPNRRVDAYLVDTFRKRSQTMDPGAEAERIRLPIASERRRRSVGPSFGLC